LNLNGWGVPQNFAEAKRCYEIACKDADDGFGWLMLGAMYRLGLGVECDLKVAKECLIKAADKGYVLAYREIGLIEQSEAKKAKGYLYRFKAGILALGISLRNRKDIRLRFDYWPNNPR
jgi:TPR repeat protein